MSLTAEEKQAAKEATCFGTHMWVRLLGGHLHL